MFHSQSNVPFLITVVLLFHCSKLISSAYTGYSGNPGPQGQAPYQQQQQYYGPRGGREYESQGHGFGPNQNQHNQYGRAAEPHPGATSAEKQPEQPSWTPVREPKQFNAFVADKIEGSHIMRQEKWDNGTMSGSYAQPIGNNKWDIITYIADDKGYRIISKKTVDESQLPSIEAAMASKEKQANINVDNNGAKTSYIVTPNQINKNPKEQEHQKKQ